MDATWMWRIKMWLGWAAAGVGIIVALFHGFELIRYLLVSQTAISIAANVYIAALSAILVCFVAYRQWLTIRKERYANIAPFLHRIAHRTRDVQSYIRVAEPRGGTQEQYKQFMTHCKMLFGEVLDQLNNVFSSLTSTHCRAAIKLLYPRGDRLFVYTLTRDQGSRDQCANMDNKRIENGNDPLDGNPHLARLFNDKEDIWYFHSRDLTSDPNFHTTSTTAYQLDYATRTPAATTGWFGRRAQQDWPLPYKSGIACVIRQGKFDLCEGLQPEVLGFLTVDSESRGVFAERWDAPIMLAAADGLYTAVRAYLDAQARAELAKSATIENQVATKALTHTPA